MCLAMPASSSRSARSMDPSPAFLIDSGENRRNAIRLRRLGWSCDVIDHDCGVVTVYVCQLERLMVNE
jgi:hypothetical protein